MEKEMKIAGNYHKSLIALLIVLLAVGANAAPGDLDLTFGIGGKVVTTTGYGEIGSAVALQADGKIVVAGAQDAFLGRGLVVRYNSDGSVDTSFGIGGLIYESAHSSHETVFNTVAIQSDGKIVVAGHFVETGGCARDQAWIVRYNTNGTRDTTFGGGDGEVEYPFLYVNGCPEDSYLNGLAIMTSGKIVAAGSAKNSAGNLDFAAARLHSNGSLDTSFNLDGLATISIGTHHDAASSVKIQGITGKIILAGYSYNSVTSNNFALVKLDTNGLVDFGFGSAGKVTIDTGSNDSIKSIALSGSNIVAAGSQTNSSTGIDFSLARLNSNTGILDTTFDGDGKVQTAFGAYSDIAFSIAVQADGRLVTAGYGRGGGDTSYNFALSRYNTNGSLDATFDVDGRQTTDFNGYSEYGRGVVIQSDGKIVVVGYAWNGLDFDIALARYMP